MKPLILAIVGPSGAGKSTLLAQCVHHNLVSRAVTWTDRLPRAGEQHGCDYWFLSPPAFQDELNAGHFIEFTNYSSCWYGTKRQDVESILAHNKNCGIVLDIRGLALIRAIWPDQVVSVFLKPASISELAQRLENRELTAADRLHRLANIEQELSFGNFCDYILPDQKTFLDDTFHILRSEWLHTRR